MNYLGILLATVAQFIIGALWYGPVFGNLWGKIHGFNDLSLEKQTEARSKMGALLGAQFVVTIVTTVVLAIFISYVPGSWNVYTLAGFLWIGFVVPTQVSAVLFGGTKPEYMVSKILIMAAGSLVCLEVAAAILKAMAS